MLVNREANELAKKGLHDSVLTSFVVSKHLFSFKKELFYFFLN